MVLVRVYSDRASLVRVRVRRVRVCSDGVSSVRVRVSGFRLAFAGLRLSGLGYLFYGFLG